MKKKVIIVSVIVIIVAVIAITAVLGNDMFKKNEPVTDFTGLYVENESDAYDETESMLNIMYDELQQFLLTNEALYAQDRSDRVKAKLDKAYEFKDTLDEFVDQIENGSLTAQESEKQCKGVLLDHYAVMQFDGVE